MDDIKKKFQIFHLLGLLLVYLFFIWVFWGEGDDRYNPFIMAGMLLLACAPLFYSHVYLLNHFWSKKKWGLYGAGLLMIVAIGPFLIMAAVGIASEEWAAFPVPYFPFLILTLIIIILSWGARVTENWFINTLKRETLEKQAMQAELSYLKSQINPHFLFNTLNNIHTLAYKNSPLTAEAIMRLSSLMRYMLYDSNAQTVPVSREIDYLQDFINLQQLRYQQGPLVDLAVAGDVENCFVAPLLFIHLLENAYKHSPAALAEGDIKIRIKVQGSSLSFSIQNPIGRKKPADVHEPGGIGLANLRKRLQLLYPDQHQLSVSNLDDLFVVILDIKGLQAQTNERQAELLYRR